LRKFAQLSSADAVYMTNRGTTYNSKVSAPPLGLNTQVRQGRALERHYHWIFVLVLLFVRGYAEEEGWPDMANGHVLSFVGGSSPCIINKK
jgi:uncharacterized membrane protein